MFLDTFFKTQNIDNIELAYELFNFDTNSKYYKQVKRIFKEYTKANEQYPDRQDIFLKAIDIIGEPQTPKEKYIVAEAYLWSRYPFKLKGIEYGNKYINSELWNYEHIKVPKNADNTTTNKKNIEISHFLHEIGLIYESEYNFDEAIKCYEREIKITPFFQFGYIDKAKALVKLNKKEEALELLKNTRNSKYYIPYSTKEYKWETEQISDDFKKSIENIINDIENKIKKNYKYRPRPSKCIWKRTYYNDLSELQKRYLEEYIKKGLVIIE